jgi:hypothetical protein
VRTRVCWLLLACSLVACGRFRKAKECDVLAKTVSAWIARQPAPNPALATPESLMEEAKVTAQNYEALDRELGALDIQSVELSSRVARYRKLARDSAHALSDVGRALSARDLELARRRRVDFDAIVQAEAPLVAEINHECKR